MSHEYLLFDALVLTPPIGLSFWRRTSFVPRWPQAFLAIAITAIPFLLWDQAVAGRHWWFNPRFVSGAYLGRLPIEEVLFFLAMPFACLFTWHTLFSRRVASGSLRWASWLSCACLPVGAWLLLTGRPAYTGAALTAFGIGAIIDRLVGTRLLEQSRVYLYLAFVAALTLVFNGYLTARPVVLYGSEHQLGLRVVTIPIEDFVYGFALVLTNLAIFEALGPSRIAQLIERRLGGYRQTIVTPNPSDKARVDVPARVLVVGSGIAGLTAAAVLADRGFSVVIQEKNAYLGGKVGAWKEELAPGQEFVIEHGFHAFFRQYYNLNRLLERVGVSQHFAAIDDYAILDKGGEVLSFKDVATAPILNLLSLAHHGIVPWRDLVTNPRLHKLEAMLRYDREPTFATFDGVSFAQFAAEASLPPRLRLAFNTFARAFFADEARMSMAELIKGFHFYYLSNDRGLLYDYLNDDYDRTFVQPFVRYLESRGATIRTNAPVARIERGFVVGGERFDAVVVAADAAAARNILLSSDVASPALRTSASGLRSSQRYAVLRVWLDRDVPRKFPVFLVTERERVLDAVTFNHWFQPAAQQWASNHAGGVYEAHCYALPDDVPDADVERLFIEEMQRRIPELAGARVVHSHLQVRGDFTAYHLGLAAGRPGVETDVPGLVLAGDWVRLPRPAMLMEAACMSGVLAANAISRQYGVREEIVEAVPATGVLVKRG